MTANPYECRDTSKSFFWEKYKEKIKPYMLNLKKVMEANNIEEIPAFLKISETSHFKDHAMTQVMYISAVVELIEPSV